MPASSIYKIILIGQECSGKTALLHRENHDKFDLTYRATIGVDFIQKTYNAGTADEKNIRLWDLAGQERFDNIIHSCFERTDAAIICVDSTIDVDKDYLNKKITALRELNPLISITLAATKIDLVGNDETINFLKSFAEENKCYFAQTSAKNKTGVNELFQTIVNQFTPSEVAAPIKESPLSELIKTINNRPEDNDEQKAFKKALLQLTDELKKSTQPGVKDQIITETLVLLKALDSNDYHDKATLFKNYLKACQTKDSLLGKLVKIVVITGLCLIFGAVLAAAMGLSLGTAAGLAITVGTAGFIGSNIAFFKKNDLEKAVQNVANSYQAKDNDSMAKCSPI